EDKNLQKNIQSGLADADQVVEELLQVKDPPTGLVITDDYNALTVMRALTSKDLKLPEDMSIVGFNNTMIARLSNPALTTVDTQSFQLGHESARSLIDLLNRPDMIKKSVIIPTVIVERDSCHPRKMIKQKD
ncbi:LacI family transcriptional regulator, partial [Halobacillus trueperi]